MAGSVNKVILVGNLGRDPEIRRMQDGRPVANLSVAMSESWRDKASGERRIGAAQVSFAKWCREEGGNLIRGGRPFLSAVGRGGGGAPQAFSLCSTQMGRARLS